jgi:hypothetical protein
MSTFRQSSSGLAATLAVAGSSVSFVSGDFSTPLVPYVRLQVLDNDVYVTYDGTTPSSANGERVSPGTGGYFLRVDVLAMKFVQSTGAARVFAQPCDLISPGNP